MTDLFQKNTGVTTDKPLIGQTNFKDHYPHVAGDLPFSDLKPDIRKAIKAQILPFIGLAEYERIVTENGEALETMRDCVAYYAIYLVLPFKPHIISNAGVNRLQPEGASQSNLSDVKYMRYAAHLESDKQLDNLLSMLPISLSIQNPFFKSGNDIRPYFNTDAVRVLYGLDIHFSNAYRDLRQWFNSTNNLDIQKQYVAYAAFADAIPFLTLVMDGAGFSVLSKGDGIEEKNSLKSKEHLQAIANLKRAAEDKRDAARGELESVLRAMSVETPLLFQPKTVETFGEGGVFL